MSQAGMNNVSGGGGGGFPIVSLTGDTGGPIFPSFPGYNVNILGGIGVEVNGTPVNNTLTVNVTTAGFDWSEEVISFTADPTHGYFCNNGLTVSLPSSIGLAIGSTVIIYVDTVSPVIIQAAGSDRIQVSQNISIVGGTATSTAQGNILELVYKPSDDTWHSISSLGTWAVV